MRYAGFASSRVLVLFVAALLTVGCGTSDDEGAGGGGTGGAGGTAGSGGTGGGGAEILVPQCVSSAYQVLFRAFVQPLDPLLRYMDTPVGSRDPESQWPPISSLSEAKDVSNVYSRFTWNADDVPNVEDPGGTVVTADFEESSGLNPANLDNGISNMEVVLVPWEMTVNGSTVSEGKLSIIGLGEDTVRITIVDYNGELPGGEPYYENLCRFEVFNFNLQLDLATPNSEPFAVQIGYTAEGTGYAIENGWITLGEGDSAGFTGDFVLGAADAIPFDFTLDYSTDPADISGTFGGVPASCTIDLATFVVAC